MLQEHTKILADEIARYEKTMVDDTKDDTKQPSDRQRIILQMITGNDTITINEMIQKTGVSAVTIKRDLAALQAMGLLRREGGRIKGRWVTA